MTGRPVSRELQGLYLTLNQVRLVLDAIEAA